jgi:hypothetical protein
MLPPRAARRAALPVALVGVAVLAGITLVNWGAPRTAVATAEGSAPAPAREPAARPNFLFVDIDTFTPDRIGVVRGGASITPVLDGLARRGVTFTHAFSQSGWTLPALSSVLTGRLPIPLTVEGNSIPWRARGVRDLPDILSYYGYSTAAFWGNTLPGPVSGGMSRSFASVSVQKRLLSAPPTEEVLGWLGIQPREPFFAYVHDIDLHAPGVFSDSDPARAPLTPGPSYEQLYTDAKAEGDEAAARERVYARYDANVHRYDAAVGRILAGLDAAGVAGRTVIVVTSDHAEDFFDHDTVGHGLLYDTTLRVPLLVVDPTAPDPGRTVDTVVQGVDLAPTVLARAGIPADVGMDGRTLLPLLGLDPGGTYVERPVFSLTAGCHASLRADGKKVIVRDGRPRTDRAWKPAGGDNGVRVPLDRFAAEHGLGDLPLPDCRTTQVDGTPDDNGPRGPGPSDILVEFYDLGADPGERTNLVADRPADAAGLLRQLLVTLATQRAIATGAPKEPLAPEQIQTIRDQGYWGLVSPDGSAGGATDGTREGATDATTQDATKRAAPIANQAAPPTDTTTQNTTDRAPPLTAPHTDATPAGATGAPAH